jgi:hypothetical protein
MGDCWIACGEKINPNKRTVRTTRFCAACQGLARGLEASSAISVRLWWFSVIRNTCQELLQYWRDVMDLARAPRQLTKDRMIEALQRAGRVYCKGQETTSSATLAITRTTSFLSDITSTKQDSKQKTWYPLLVFSICILESMVSSDTVSSRQEQASQALKALQNEQLKPRGLEVDGVNSCDFKEVYDSDQVID